MAAADCDHPMTIKEMCAVCGMDLRAKCGYVGRPENTPIAKVAVVHNIPELMVSTEIAKVLGKADQDRLLDSRKLVLLVDLDQTLIHTTTNRVPSDLVDVYKFRDLHRPCTYSVKLRPNTRQFLENMSKYFEMHICTFGVRWYAHKIADILDPEQRYFHSSRILSRDECFDPYTKTANLKALFPNGDKLVCIIDDREDVWHHAPNLIRVKPYRFWKDTGDINAPPVIEKPQDRVPSPDLKVETGAQQESINEDGALDNDTMKDIGKSGESAELNILSDGGLSRVVTSNDLDGLVEVEEPLKQFEHEDNPTVDGSPLECASVEQCVSSSSGAISDVAKSESTVGGYDLDFNDPVKDDTIIEKLNNSSKVEFDSDDLELSKDLPSSPAASTCETIVHSDDKNNEKHADSCINSTEPSSRDMSECNSNSAEPIVDSHSPIPCNYKLPLSPYKKNLTTRFLSPTELKNLPNREEQELENYSEKSISEPAEGEAKKSGYLQDKEVSGFIDENSDGISANKDPIAMSEGGKASASANPKNLAVGNGGEIDENKENDKEVKVIVNSGGSHVNVNSHSLEEHWIDKDDYLYHLEVILIRIHRAFYQIHDKLAERNYVQKTDDVLNDDCDTETEGCSSKSDTGILISGVTLDTNVRVSPDSNSNETDSVPVPDSDSNFKNRRIDKDFPGKDSDENKTIIVDSESSTLPDTAPSMNANKYSGKQRRRNINKNLANAPNAFGDTSSDTNGNDPPVKNYNNDSSIPDLKLVVPYVRRKVLKNVHLVFSAVIPRQQRPETSYIYNVAMAFGATVSSEIEKGHQKERLERNKKGISEEHSSSNSSSRDSASTGGADTSLPRHEGVSSSASGSARSNSPPPARTTHVVANKWGTSKVHEAARMKPRPWIVTPEWVYLSVEKWHRQKERRYLLKRDSTSSVCPSVPSSKESKSSRTEMSGEVSDDSSNNSSEVLDEFNLMILNDEKAKLKERQMLEASTKTLPKLSAIELEGMRDEVKEFLGDDDDSENDTTDSEDRDNTLKNDDDDDDEDSLSGDEPLGLRKSVKRCARYIESGEAFDDPNFDPRRIPELSSSQKRVRLERNLERYRNMEDDDGERSEESEGEILKLDDDDDDDDSSIGSVDNEMLEAMERDFNS